MAGYGSGDQDLKWGLPSFMKFVIDMVHHNPGEPPFETAFNDPARLREYGFNGQVFKHLSCAADFGATGLDIFPCGSKERCWHESAVKRFHREIAAAKAQGLDVFYHIDLFVFPKRLVQAFAREICDASNGTVLLASARTLELLRLMFAELSERFPDVDGYIIRVGETYLHDAPYHTGNGPIRNSGPKWSADYLYREALNREPLPMAWSETEVKAYVLLLRFLRDEVCERLGKYILFRTWDIYPDKLHARCEHYLAVTDQVPIHPKLFFSIKHTALDFWRNVNVNPCLGAGQHGQVIEVQCQREYEGKGSFPNYLMHGLFNGFPENAGHRGLRDLAKSPLFAGVYSWSRGGGWEGPKISNELWPDLNMFVLGGLGRNAESSEENLFNHYARDRLRLSVVDTRRFRELCLLSSEAVRLARYCGPFDAALRGELLPTGNWLRDDRLGGRAQLAPVFQYLVAEGKLNEALREKADAVELARRMSDLAGEITSGDPEARSFLQVSALYGLRLFTIIEAGWRVLGLGVEGEITGAFAVENLVAAVADYERAWSSYNTLAAEPNCPSLFKGYYLPSSDDPAAPGLDEAVRYYAELTKRLAHFGHSER